MSERGKHLFHFTGRTIAEYARGEADYHRKRMEFWQREFREAVAIVKKTAGVEVKELQITGGTRVDVVVDYGDMAAYRRMQEAQSKIQTHREAAEKYDMDANTYGTQGDRSYELATDDVHYYRLGGGPRPE